MLKKFITTSFCNCNYSCSKNSIHIGRVCFP